MNGLAKFITTLLCIFTSSAIMYFSWNYIAAKFLFFLPEVYHSMGYWEIFAFLFVLRSISMVIWNHTDLDSKTARDLK